MEQKIENLTIKPELQFTEGEELYRITSFEVEAELDSKLSEVTSFIEDPENSGNGVTEEEKDILYLKAQDLLKEFKKCLRDSVFNFNLNRDQYKLLTTLLNNKLEYDVNSLFIALELTEMLEEMHGVKYKGGEDELVCFPVTATDITYVYHLISQYKVKGLTKEARSLASVLIRIGEISKLVSYYDSTSKNLTEDITKWAIGMNSDMIITGEFDVESTDTESVEVSSENV